MRIVIERYYSNRTFAVYLQEFDAYKFRPISSEITVPEEEALCIAKDKEMDIYSAALECAMSAYLSGKAGDYEIQHYKGERKGIEDGD